VGSGPREEKRGAHVSISIWTSPDNSPECRVQQSPKEEEPA